MNPDPHFLSLLQKIGFNPSVDIGIFPATEDLSVKNSSPRFWFDSNENLCCSVIDLDGFFICNKSAKKNIDTAAHVKLIAKPKTVDESQYIVGGTYPFFWKNTLKVYSQKKQLNTLVICSGPIESFFLDNIGIPVIGLPGPLIWKRKNQAEIFDLVKDFLLTCNPETIVWLTPGDSLKVKWKENKDLSRQPYNLLTSIQLFKDLTQNYTINQYWLYINDPIHITIYDLYFANAKNKKNIFTELTMPTVAKDNFFVVNNVGKQSYFSIRQILCIHGKDNEEIVENFYKKYEDEISLKPFIFGRGVYEYNQVEKTVQYIRAGEAQQFVMVGSKLYIKGPQQTESKQIENVLIPIDKTGFENKFRDRSKKERDRIWLDIPYYDRFVNEPDHLDYEQSFIIEDPNSGFSFDYYNRYNRISWVPKEGPCDLSIQFMQHIFGFEKKLYKGKEYVSWELGLDYAQVLYLHPKHKLPIVCPVSLANNTGKSLFAEWFEEIFQSNCRSITPEELTGQFTASFVSCLLVYMDETFIEKQSTFERLKYLVTARRNKSEEKFGHQDKVKCHLHLIVISNNARDFIKIKNEDVRPWILTVPKIPEDRRDRDFRDKLFAEIPAFLHFLQNRKFHCEREDRLWFPAELTETEGLAEVKQASQTHAESILEMIIIPYFQDCKKIQIDLSPGDIQSLLKQELAEQKFSAVQIREALKKRSISINKYSNKYIFYSRDLADDQGDFYIKPSTKRNRCYTIAADQFLDPQELRKTFEDADLIELEKLAKNEKRKTWYQVMKENPARYKLEYLLEYIQKCDTWEALTKLKTDKDLPF